MGKRSKDFSIGEDLTHDTKDVLTFSAPHTIVLLDSHIQVTHLFETPNYDDLGFLGRVSLGDKFGDGVLHNGACDSEWGCYNSYDLMCGDLTKENPNISSCEPTTPDNRDLEGDLSAKIVVTTEGCGFHKKQKCIKKKKDLINFFLGTQ
jgi:hypothetical protein